MSPELSRRMLGRTALATVAAAGAPLAARADDLRDRVLALLPELTTMLQDGMAAWHVPGMAVGVALGGEVIFARGLGVRRAGGADPVGTETVFQIGSTTKAFAATTEAIMVDRGKLGWMDRVIDHDPEFRMFDPWVTQEFRIVDLLSQRSGLRAYVLDALWPLGYAPDALVAGLRHVAPISSFRTTFAYQNVLHQVAGRIVARLAGVAHWQDALAQLILEPLGMHATTTTAEALLAAPDHATGHAYYADRLTSLPPLATFPYGAGPAGGINSSLSDMLKWLRFLIGRGETGSHRLLGATALETTWKPRVEINAADGFPWVWQSYASGWVTRQTKGGVAIWHNGGTQQFKTHVGFVPALNVGIVVLSNEGANELVDAVGLWFYDRLLGNDPTDYNGQALTRAAEAAKLAETTDRRPAAPAPAKPAADYAGAYVSQIGGMARIGPGDGGGLSLHLETPGTSFGLAPWDGDVFALTSQEPALAATLAAAAPPLAQFRRTAQGAVETMQFDGEPEVVFRRTKDAG